ncbi:MULTISPECIES: hypothetical protein [unclassified Streptomyces]|uniref:hypothetical protein n=1 Tax=unclassified Streptomyces TaxID=2593676 RepID=UPI003415D1B3
MLVSPELADVLSTIVRRPRGGSGAIPLLTSYDVHERVWNPVMPLLFQRDIGTEHRAFTPTALRKLLINALAATGMTHAGGEPLVISPYDFRRIFVTDVIMNGLPPHIAQVICGHRSLDTTMGSKAIYPAETIEAHRAFIACRRATRPSDEYRTPTEEEWDAFLAHFEKRKVSIGTCDRAFSSPCVHEHACVRCSLLRPDPAQRGRLEEIRDNLLARSAEAEREGRLGEVEGLKDSTSASSAPRISSPRSTGSPRRPPSASACLRAGAGTLSSDAHREEPGHDLSTWTLDQLQTFVHDARGRQLETARVAAQGKAYNSSHSQGDRRQWAKLSLLANRRMLDHAGGHPARVAQQDFMLRMWVIDWLGPDDRDLDWSPEALASDTLDALTFTPPQAAALAEGWRDLPTEQIRELRRHKNLTAHLERLVGYLVPGPVRERLVTWTATRRLLP